MKPSVNSAIKSLAKARQEDMLDSVVANAETYIGDRLENLRFGNCSQCFYCGDWLNMEIDHCIPLSYVLKYKRSIRYVRNLGITVYSCRECNQILYDKMFWDFENRFRYVRNVLRKRLIKYYRCATWTKGEMNKLDYTLKTYVQSNQFMSEIAAKRMDWETSMSFKRECRNLRVTVRSSDNEFTKNYFQGFLLSVN